MSTSTTPMTEHPLQSAEHDRRIDYIELSAADVAATKRFYVDAFGWKFTDYGPDYTSFEDGRITGGFRKDASASRGGPLIVIFAVDLTGAEGRVRKAGGTIVKSTFSFPGGRRFHFTDPSGNELAVWSDR
jgi:predicted enzyme related to lactoylglutathione lyase